MSFMNFWKNKQCIACFLVISCINIAYADNQDYNSSSGEWKQSGRSYTHAGAIFSEFRYSSEDKSTNTYKYEVTPPSGWSFAASKTTFSGGDKISDPTATYSGIQKVNNASNDPASFVLSMGGELTKSGSGSGTVIWNASANSKFFYLTSSPSAGADLLVPIGTEVTVTAQENGSPKDSKWKINNTSIKGDPTEKSIVLKESAVIWWNPDTWFTYNYPIAGNYTVTATAVDGGASATKLIAYLDTYFSKGNSSGYDDFTGWQKDENSNSKSEAYYASPKKGQSGVVYVAVKKGSSMFSVNLNLNPSPIGKDIDIMKTGTSVTTNKTTTKTSTGIILNATSIGETTVKAKLDSHNFLRHAVISSFNEKTANYWVVYIGAEYNGSIVYPETPPSLANINSTFQQAIFKIQVSHSEHISYSNHPPIIKVSNKNIYECMWSESKINELITSLDPPVNTGVIVIMHGYIQNRQTEFGSSTTGKRSNEVSFIWTGASMQGNYLTLERPYIVPHETAHHFLGESHVSGDKHNLLTEDSDLENLGNYNFLRKNQWGGFHD